VLQRTVTPSMLGESRIHRTDRRVEIAAGRQQKPLAPQRDCDHMRALTDLRAAP
jgi:hypothetical protein